MMNSKFKFSNIIFYASLILSIIYFTFKIVAFQFYHENNLIITINISLNSTYLLINMIFIILFLVYLSKMNKKIKILSIKFKMNLHKKGIFNYSLLVLLIILLFHLITSLALKISFINVLSQTLSPILYTFFVINLITLFLSLMIYSFLIGFSNVLNKIYKLLKINVFLKKTIETFELLIKKNKFSTINLINFRILTNFKVNYIMFNTLQWQETLRKACKLNNDKKASAPGYNPIFM